jgi:drug/metabolite transporter (DMT)-like permease
MSVVAPISSTGTAVPVLVGIVSGERPSAIQLCGMALAAGGVIVASREAPGADAAARRTNRLAIVLALLAAAGFGFFFVAMDRAHDHADVAWVLLAARAPDAVIFGALIALGAAGRARRVRLPVRPPSLSRPPGGVAGLLPLAGVGLADGGANLLFTLATAEGLLSVVGVLGSLYPVMTVVLARALLGERLTRLQDGGVLATLAGVIVIAGG